MLTAYILNWQLGVCPDICKRLSKLFIEHLPITELFYKTTRGIMDVNFNPWSHWTIGYYTIRDFSAATLQVYTSHKFCHDIRGSNLFILGPQTFWPLLTIFVDKPTIQESFASQAKGKMTLYQAKHQSVEKSPLPPPVRGKKPKNKSKAKITSCLPANHHSAHSNRVLPSLLCLLWLDPCCLDTVHAVKIGPYPSQ